MLSPRDPKYANAIDAELGVVNQPWNILPNADGSFLIRNDKTQKCIDFNTDNNRLVQAQGCDASNSKQNWYVQPDGNGGHWIRNVNNNKCMDVSEQTVGFPVGLYDCGAGSANQIFRFEVQGGNSGNLDDMATLHALKQFDAGSSAIREAKYSITDSTQKATQGDYQLVSVSSDKGGPSPYCGNRSGPSGGDMSCGFTWQQSVADTISSSHTAGLTVTVGTGKESKSPVSVQVAAQYQHTWGTSQTTTATSGSNVSVTVPPGQTAWLARALAYKTVTGTWTITSDHGVTWTGQGTSTKAVEGIDGVHSYLIKCTMDSTDPGCKATAPPGTAVK
ncbi:ricin-type beta-trefoil lectin domain protein [Streptomyces inhibens]|uniref:ricin-type beta-trefoil lectin domain protein n=1 Tax=Streptomyces inhibens TaxID=2293571 RepID=UPI00402A8512